ncbi:hypothetical protein [Aliiglaciecola litoralis]|uniref:Uncharacterized protein n=1 Tax=Aliiglaciecola litoralis TaxID=582857 RepID=A0ABN1LTK9_9ALTE
MNLYPQLASSLENALDKHDVISIGDAWMVFREQYLELKKHKPKTMADLGIQAELFIDNSRDLKQFYFAFHYRVKCKLEGEVYEFYELVYCEFDVKNAAPALLKTGDAIEAWESFTSFKGAVKRVDEWEVLRQFKDLQTTYKVYGTEV